MRHAIITASLLLALLSLPALGAEPTVRSVGEVAGLPPDTTGVT